MSQHAAFAALSPTTQDTYKLLQDIKHTQAQTLRRLEDLANVTNRRLDGIESAMHSVTMAVNSEISLQHLTLRTAGPRLVNEPVAIERVLEHLPIRSILRFQRVNKRCKAVVDSSERMQWVLLMLPESSFSASGCFVTPRLNPLFATEALSKAAPVFGAKFDYGAEGLRIATILPIEQVYERKGSHSVPVLKLTIHTWTMETWTSPHVGELHAGLNANTPGFATGSWKKMYLSQPPVPVDVSYDGYASHNKCPIERRSGTLEELIRPWENLLEDRGCKKRSCLGHLG